MSALSDKLKEKGLELTEDQVKALAEGIFEFVEFTVKESENKFDDSVIAFLPFLKGLLMPLVDKIDSKVD